MLKIKNILSLTLLQLVFVSATAQVGKIVYQYKNEKEIKDEVSVTLMPGVLFRSSGNDPFRLKSFSKPELYQYQNI